MNFTPGRVQRSPIGFNDALNKTETATVDDLYRIAARSTGSTFRRPTAWSAVDEGHVRFVVALAGGRRQVVEPLELVVAQFDAVGGGVLLDAEDPPGAGIGAMFSPWASSQARAICADVAPASAATAWTSSTMARLRWKFSPVKRGLVLLQSSSGCR